MDRDKEHDRSPNLPSLSRSVEPWTTLTADLPANWSAFLGPKALSDLECVVQRLAASDAQDPHILPPRSDIFRALTITPPQKVQVVILGQDPYHGLGQAHGLAFSVPIHVTLPPSLRNIFKELKSDLGLAAIPQHGDLTPWAKRGVLLLNAALTVIQGKAGSHQKIGWQTFTDQIIKSISEHSNHVSFILWGQYAIQKKHLINVSKHQIITCVHPSPLSAHRGFFDSRPFTSVNNYRKLHGLAPINWSL